MFQLLYEVVFSVFIFSSYCNLRTFVVVVLITLTCKDQVQVFFSTHTLLVF